ncbi:MAG: hypothetical protein WKF78_13885 [Candidatus Limnocylindrales bacterium]
MPEPWPRRPRPHRRPVDQPRRGPRRRSAGILSIAGGDHRGRGRRIGHARRQEDPAGDRRPAVTTGHPHDDLEGTQRRRAAPPGHRRKQPSQAADVLEPGASRAIEAAFVRIVAAQPLPQPTERLRRQGQGQAELAALDRDVLERPGGEPLRLVDDEQVLAPGLARSLPRRPRRRGSG